MLNQIESNPTSDLSLQWDDLIEEMIGNSQSLKQEFINELMNDKKVSNVAKEWLKSI